MGLGWAWLTGAWEQGAKESTLSKVFYSFLALCLSSYQTLFLEGKPLKVHQAFKPHFKLAPLKETLLWTPARN